MWHTLKSGISLRSLLIETALKEMVILKGLFFEYEFE